MRLENILALVSILFYWLAYTKKIDRKKWLLPGISSLPFFASYIFQYYHLVGFYRGIYVRKINLFGIGGLAKKLDLLNDLRPGFFMLLIVAFLIIGLISMYRNNPKAPAFLMLWFASFSFFYVFYVYADDFHALTGLIALLPIAAYGLNGVLSRIAGCFHHGYLPIIYTAGTLLIFMLFFVSFDANSDPYLALETKSLGLLGADVPANCVVAAEVPIILDSYNGIITMSTISLLDDTPPGLTHFRGRCLLYFEDLYCHKNLTASSVKRCRQVHSNFNLEAIKEYSYKNATFYLYNVSAKT